MKATTIGLGALVLAIGVVSVSVGSAMAYRGDSTVHGPNFSVERHEALEKAFENNDYDAWKGLMQGRGRVSQVVNRDNFPRFVEAHKLMEQGKTAEAQKIRQELGLGAHNGAGKGMGKGGAHECMNR